MKMAKGTMGIKRETVSTANLKGQWKLQEGGVQHLEQKLKIQRNMVIIY